MNSAQNSSLLHSLVGVLPNRLCAPLHCARVQYEYANLFQTELQILNTHMKRVNKTNKM
jgi:hypothetical protein